MLLLANHNARCAVSVLRVQARVVARRGLHATKGARPLSPKGTAPIPWRGALWAGAGLALATGVLLDGSDQAKRTQAGGHARCKRCGSTDLYLDAATSTHRCVRCERQGTKVLAAPSSIAVVREEFEDGGSVQLFPKAFSSAEAHRLMRAVWAEVGWQQHRDVVEGVGVVAQPRLIAYQAAEPDDPALVYSYENLEKPLVPTPFTPTVLRLKERMEELTGARFNSVHLNLYRTGNDYVSWHTDEDVALYGPEPTICSVSLGCEREFVLRRMDGTGDQLSLFLGNGSVLVMGGSLQRHWEHCVRKESEQDHPRINMTFRWVVEQP